MDVRKRYTDTNVELKAQGIGNILSSLIGGLPMTSVVVRSSANNAGAKSKMSAIIHGVLLLISVLAVPVILNKIPLATLATILILVGYKPNRRPLFTLGKRKISIYSFIATLVAVVTTDLLKEFFRYRI
jgi:MFS superfamily sulfate permease-like transporter